MSPETIAKRLASHPRFKWEPGMHGTLPDGRAIRVANDHAPYWGGAGSRVGNYVTPDTVLDLADPATAGCLLDLYIAECGGSAALALRSLAAKIEPEQPIGETLAEALLAVWGAS